MSTLDKTETKRLYGRTKRGLISHIYQGQKTTSKRRGHKAPSYTRGELHNWLYAQIKFHRLYNEWKEADYKLNSKPSIDRKDDFKPYTFSNIQLMTHKENNAKPKQKQCKGVVQMTRYSKKLINSFPSTVEAYKQTGIDYSTISKVARGERDHAGGYYWAYAEEDS